jgi:ATP/maltotriose-dependent transcriptional regulator MalT
MSYNDKLSGSTPGRDASDDVALGRESYQRGAWLDAFQALSRADNTAPLGPEDLELLAMAAYLLGRDDDYLATLERAHQAHLAASADRAAARCAFWLGLRLLSRGEAGRATGWIARAQRLLERDPSDCAERGYLLLPAVQRHILAGNWEAAHSSAATAAEIGERFQDADLIACARQFQGRVLIRQGRVEEGLKLLDETMVAVSAGELSPLVTGLVYCSVIEGCQEVYALDRAREWTGALAAWCAKQPDMVAFSGTCLVHRAEILQLRGKWGDAAAEAERACSRFLPGLDQRPHAAAFYQQAEVYRLRGDVDDAEAAYRSASQWGWEPQPGLALLRLAQGRADTAAAAIRRVANATTEPLERARLLPAVVEILLAVGDVADARAAAVELHEIAARFDTRVLHALAAHALGAVEFAEGDAQTALTRLQRAWEVWQSVNAPYLAARVRVMIGLSCRALNDEDGSALEFSAARAAFETLGAIPDIAHVDTLISSEPAVPNHGLTTRELQVLRLVAAGKSNKTIAVELGLSEKTIDRHLSNIYDKLDVPSRTAAAAYAFAYKLV